MRHFRSIAILVGLAISLTSLSAQNSTTVAGQSDEGDTLPIDLDFEHVLPEFEVYPQIYDGHLPKLGEPVPFGVHVVLGKDSVADTRVILSCEGDCSIDRKEIVSDSKGMFTVNVKMNKYGDFKLNLEYHDNDKNSSGDLWCSCEYHFSLYQDETWHFNIAVDDKLTQPFQTYSMEGDLPFVTFNYGGFDYDVHYDTDKESGVIMSMENKDNEMTIAGVDDADMYLTASNGRKHHTITGGIIDPKDNVPEAFIVFDPSQLKKMERKSKAATRDAVVDMLGLLTGTRKEFEAEATVTPPLLMRLPLQEGTQKFDFNLFDPSGSSQLLGFEMSDIASSEFEIDRDDMMSRLKRSKGCAVFPSTIRLSEVLRLGNLMMFIATQGQDGNGTFNGTATLRRVK